MTGFLQSAALASSSFIGGLIYYILLILPIVFLVGISAAFFLAELIRYFRGNFRHLS